MRRKRLLFSLTAAALCLALVFVVGELLVTFFAPMASLYPRYQFSPEYRMLPFAGSTMVHSQPGGYRFEYHVNSHHHRGPEFEDVRDDRRRVVVVGDSNAFGMGVAEGEEFPRRLNEALGSGYDVVNLGAPGWGLTQEIRRYYELGAKHNPAAVVLQFCGNDPDDNLKNRVTVVEDGAFRFRDSRAGVNAVKKFLSRSPLQKSQLYNFIRQNAYLLWKQRDLQQSEQDLARSQDQDEVAPRERFHADLLELFARRLQQDSVELVMISVNGQLESFPHLHARVQEMTTQGLLTYLDVRPWFEGVQDYSSAEGHDWGAPAHAIVGERLARHLLANETANLR